MEVLGVERCKLLHDVGICPLEGRVMRLAGLDDLVLPLRRRVDRDGG